MDNNKKKNPQGNPLKLKIHVKSKGMEKDVCEYNDKMLSQSKNSMNW